MADEPKKSPIASQFSGLPMKALIGGPLKAAADANAMMAKTQTDFLLDYCFARHEEDPGKLRTKMVKFQVERSVLAPDGSVQDTPLKMDFSLPLMTLIPINSLAIKEMEISFDMEVKSSREHKMDNTTNQTGSSKKQKNQRAYNFDTELHGTLSKKATDKTQSQSHADYQVKLSAGQLPLPNGVTAILDIFTKSIAPLPSKYADAKTDSGEEK